MIELTSTLEIMIGIDLLSIGISIYLWYKELTRV